MGRQSGRTLRPSTMATLSARERAMLERGHEWVRIGAFVLGTVLAVAFGMKPDLGWLIAVSGFVALVFPALRLAGRIEADPRRAMIIDLFYGAIVTGAAANWPVVVISVTGTLLISWVVLAPQRPRLGWHAFAAVVVGVFLAQRLGMDGAVLEDSPVATVAAIAVTAVVTAAVGVTLTVIRQWMRRVQTERDAAQAGIQVAMDVAAVSVMVINGAGRVVSRAGWSGLPVTADDDHRRALAAMPQLAAMVKAALDGAEVSASVFVGDRVLNAAAAPVFQGRVQWAASLAVSDITEPVTAGRRADQASRWKSDFIATVSHEIRTPLTAVLGFLAEVDARVGTNDPLVREYLQIVSEQAQEAADIVEDLLVATRQEAGELSILAEGVDLPAEVARVLTGLGDRASRVAVEGTACHVVADRSRVRQIVRNLVTNAIKYGGEQVRVTVGENDDTGVLEVADDGSGISITSRDLVFRPFFQVGERHAPGGFGLGLSVSRALAEAMGGSLVYDCHGGWSRFVLRLPARPPEPSTGETTRRSPVEH